MSLEPDVVDLRSSGPEPDPSLDNDAASNRSAVLGGIALLLLGIAIGWFLAGDGGEAPPPAAAAGESNAVPAPATVAPDPDAAPTPAPLAGGPSTEGSRPAGSAVLSDAATPPREQILVAGVTPLGDVGRLAGPIRLAPGVDAAVELGLDPTGSVSVSIAATGGAETGLPAGAPRGLPLSEVADGLLFVPVDYALGAVAYWSPDSRTALPVPDSPYGTSYLSARGDLGVFLSEDEVVVRDLRRFADVLRLDRTIAGVPIIGAWVDPSASAMVMVSRDGLGRAVALVDGTTLVEFTTDTPLRGVAWTGPDQLAFLAIGGGGQVVRALDVGSGAIWDIAGLEAGSSWKLAARP